MIERILMVAARDFKAVMGAKAFIIGLLLVPALLLLAFTFGSRLFSAVSSGPPVRGEIAVIDRSGRVLPALRAALEPQAIAARRAKAAAELPPGAPQSLLGQPPLLTVRELPGNTPVAAEKPWLLQQPAAVPAAHASGAPGAAGAAPHLALVVIAPDAAGGGSTPPGSPYGSYEMYVSKGANDIAEESLHEVLREALVSTRMQVNGADRADIERMLEVKEPRSVVVAAGGDQSTQPVLRRILPVISAALLLITVMTGGQGLMMSMVEEKSNRVVEVLLAAVSPFELMCGKLLAQLGVGLLMLTVYVGLGFVALGGAAAAGAIEPALVVDLVVMFLLAYVTYGVMMLTIGAAVSSIQDAQALMAPVMILVMIPYLLSVFAMFAPASPVIVFLSFVPPVNSFLMLARIASESPPPFWEVPVTVALGLAFAVGVLWFAAKVFKIGLLMHGKPPSFATLVRWARMA